MELNLPVGSKNCSSAANKNPDVKILAEICTYLNWANDKFGSLNNQPGNNRPIFFVKLGDENLERQFGNLQAAIKPVVDGLTRVLGQKGAFIDEHRNQPIFGMPIRETEYHFSQENNKS